MIQICRKDKEKVYDAIRTSKIDAAELSFPNLIDDNVPVNTFVVHDTKTDTSRTARQIINTYELRPEIEEDFCQMKDF